MTKTLLALLITLPAFSVAAAQSSDTLPARVAERQIEKFNRRDLEGFMALYADDAIVAEFPSGKVHLQGKAAIRAHYAPAFQGTASPPIRVEPRVVDGAFVLDNERWDDQPGEKDHAVWMYEIRGGLIQRAWAVRM